jgi:hypothetical protein
MSSKALGAETALRLGVALALLIVGQRRLGSGLRLTEVFCTVLFEPEGESEAAISEKPNLIKSIIYLAAEETSASLSSAELTPSSGILKKVV